MASLNDIKPGGRARIIKLCGRNAITRRMIDMGVVPGAEVMVERVAPLGDPIAIKIKGYHLSLRRAEAATVAVE
jgi:Fe2+ transport system protein FeoA